MGCLILFAATADVAAELLLPFEVGCPPILLLLALAMNLGDCIEVSTNGAFVLLFGAAAPTALEVVADEVAAAFLTMEEDAPSDDGSPLLIPAMVE